MNEYIDILSKEGFLIGKTALKSEIHKNGLYHNTAHIWFYTIDGCILLAQRAATKTIYPLLWDISVAGHVLAGETIINAAIRETSEEIGLDITENVLEEIGVFECFQSYKNGIMDNEFHHTFIAELKVPLQQLTPLLEEVQALKLVSFDEFKILLSQSENNNHFVLSNLTYYEMVLNSIQKKLKS